MRMVGDVVGSDRARINRSVDFCRALDQAECTMPQIASITGQSPRDVEAILESHYLGGCFELAEQAIVKANAKYG